VQKEAQHGQHAFERAVNGRGNLDPGTFAGEPQGKKVEKQLHESLGVAGYMPAIGKHVVVECASQDRECRRPKGLETPQPQRGMSKADRRLKTVRRTWEQDAPLELAHLTSERSKKVFAKALRRPLT
jgi:hypothetical protein